MIKPFGYLINFLAEESGLEKDNITYRISYLMKNLDDPDNWTSDYQGKIRAELHEINLKYPWYIRRVIIAKRAIMYATTELIDAGLLMNEKRLEFIFRTHDFLIPFLPEQKKPQFILQLKKDDDSYSDVEKGWIEKIKESERIKEELVEFKKGWKVIGEHTIIQSLYWGKAKEVYMMQIALEGKTKTDDYYIFGSAFQRLTKEYHKLDGFEDNIIIIRDHRFDQFYLKSNWLAINPSLAKYVGWIPEEDKLFAWKDKKGNLMVESIFWTKGNTQMSPPKIHSEAGEGWIVIASEKALKIIQDASGQLSLEKYIHRSKWEDEQLLQNEHFVKMKL